MYTQIKKKREESLKIKDNNKSIYEIDLIFDLMRLKMESGYLIKESPKTQMQLSFLKNISKITSFPSTDTKYDISYILQLQYKTVSIWFQNNRQRKRGEKKKGLIIDANYQISREVLFNIFLYCNNSFIK